MIYRKEGDLMHLSKYPVTSKNGNEYMVNVYERYSITYAEIL